MPGRARALNVACRSVHLASFGLLLGGHAWAVAPDRLAGALWVTIASGLALVALESGASPRWLVEGRGVLVLAKLGLLLAVPFAWEHRLGLLIAIVVVASVGSHMPSRFRHVPAHRILAAELGWRWAVPGKGELT